MATFKDPRNGRWRYRFSFRGKRYKGSAPKERNREKVAADLERQHLDRLVAQKWDGAMPTVTGFIATFLDHQKARVKPLTHELQTTHLKKHVEPHLGKKKLDQIGTAELDQLVTEWKKSAAPRTINVRLGTLLRMLGLAVEWKMLVAPPKANALKIPKDAPRFLSWPEALSLIEASDPENSERSDAPEWRSMIVVGLRTGMRVGELRGLQWGDIDFARSLVHVRRTDPGRPGHEATSPKSGKDRIIPLTPDALRTLREKFELDGKPSPSSWVWPSQRDRRRTRGESNCKHAIDAFARRAGVKDVGWHTLRHTFASWAVMRRIPLRVVQDWLGHASIKMTERYAHLAPDYGSPTLIASLDMPMLSEAPALTLPQPKSED